MRLQDVRHETRMFLRKIKMVVFCKMCFFACFVAAMILLCATMVVSMTLADTTKKEPYMTIEELKSFCRQSGFCGKLLCCEGKEVKVKGYLDPVNIFDKSRYPMLPYQKFRIVDSLGNLQSNNFLEIYPKKGDIGQLFEKLHKLAASPQKMIYIRGMIEGFDAYSNLGRNRFFYLTIDAKGVSVVERVRVRYAYFFLKSINLAS